MRLKMERKTSLFQLRICEKTDWRNNKYWREQGIIRLFLARQTKVGSIVGKDATSKSSTLLAFAQLFVCFLRKSHTKLNFFLP